MQSPASYQERRDVERWPSKTHSSETQMHLLEEDLEMEGSGASLLGQVGVESQGLRMAKGKWE